MTVAAETTNQLLYAAYSGRIVEAAELFEQVIRSGWPHRDEPGAQVDSAVALLSHRVRGLCAIDAEPALLRLASTTASAIEQQDDRATRSPLAALLAIVLCGLRPPFHKDELPVSLVTLLERHAQDMYRDDPDLGNFLADPMTRSSLASAAAVAASLVEPTTPGTMSGWIAGTVARAGLPESYGEADRASWFERVLGRVRTSEWERAPRPPVGHPLGATMVHLQALECVAQLGVVDRKLERVHGAVRALTDLAGHNRDAPTAFAILARVMRLASALPMDDVLDPRRFVGAAIAQLGALPSAEFVPADDLLNVLGFPFRGEMAAAASKGWAALRAGLASIDRIPDSAARWRAAASIAECIDTLLAALMLDPELASRGPEWSRLLQALFRAHAFDWRERQTPAAPPADVVRLVSSGSQIVCTLGEKGPALHASKESLAQLLWHQRRSAIWSVGPDELPIHHFADDEALADAGMYAAYRAMRSAGDRVPLASFVNLMSTKLEHFHAWVKAAGFLPCADGPQYVASVGLASTLPWELADGLDRPRAVLVPPPRVHRAGLAPAIQRVRMPCTVTMVPDPTRTLPSARLEQDLLASLFGDRLRIVRTLDAATLDRLGQQTDIAILHIAAHAVACPADPRLNALEVGRAGEPLTARAIADSDLSRIDLVVLNCCETNMTGPQTVVGGQSSLVGAFLAAGAGAVVGTHWIVHDECALAFSDSLYRAIERHTPLVEAVALGRSAAFIRAQALAGPASSFLASPFVLYVRGVDAGA